MLTKRIIPCLDVHAGRVVKGVNFVDLKDAGDPVAIARRYSDEGADEIVFLDITASSDERDLILPIIEQVASQVFIPLTVGGGVRSVADIRRLLNAGADKVSMNSAALADPQLIAQAALRYGSQCIVVAIDAKMDTKVDAKVDTNADAKDNEKNDVQKIKGSSKITAPLQRTWSVYTHGGRRQTQWQVLAWAQEAVRLGAGEILLTSMDADGTKAGFDLALTRAVSDAVTVPLIASGGVGNLQDLANGVIEGHADAVLAASIFHFGEYTIKAAKAFMAAQGLPMRL